MNISSRTSGSDHHYQFPAAAGASVDRVVTASKDDPSYNGNISKSTEGPANDF
jgi:hypothetical protein